MKVGIDAKWLFNGPPSGRIVVKQLVKELLRGNYKQHQFYFFLDRKDKNLPFPYPIGDNVLVYVNSPLNLISNLFILPKYSKKYNLDVVLFQNFGSHSKINKVVYIHDVLFIDYPEFFSFKERLYFSLFKPLARKAQSIITISQTEKDRIIKHQFGRENVSYVHHGVDEKFKPLSEHNINDVHKFKEKYNLPNEFILYLGRLNVRKNIINLINAMKSIELPLVIIGSHDHKSDDLKGRIRELDLEEKIFFTGFIKECELPLAYASAKIFCFPSYAEGFGLPPLEAMASGTPVIVSNRTSLPEVCGDAALYIDPDQPLDIAEKINNLLASEKEMETLSQKGIDWSKKFTWETSVKKLMNILSQYEKA